MLGFGPKITQIVQGLRVEELRLSLVFRRLLTASAFFCTFCTTYNIVD